LPGRGFVHQQEGARSELGGLIQRDHSRSDQGRLGRSAQPASLTRMGRAAPIVSPVVLSSGKAACGSKIQMVLSCVVSPCSFSPRYPVSDPMGTHSTADHGNGPPPPLDSDEHGRCPSLISSFVRSDCRDPVHADLRTSFECPHAQFHCTKHELYQSVQRVELNGHVMYLIIDPPWRLRRAQVVRIENRIVPSHGSIRSIP
jgi:hypothetical protein